MKRVIWVILLIVVAVACFLIGKSTIHHDAPVYSLDSSIEASTVSTTGGQICGFIEDGIYTYKGVPYAEAARFEKAHAPKAWDGVRSSRYYGPTCPQAFRTGWYNDEGAYYTQWDDGYPGEDCLRINIWTPGINDGKKRPVMFWIHGGGFATGSGQEHPGYDGHNMAAKGDVVFVSINHRLNTLGFLDLSAFGEKYETSGNNGMLDIVAALEWVRDNIENFGGDPGNVTIMGQSGGGGKVSTLYCMESAIDLFHLDTGTRAQTLEQADIKAKDGGAPVYVYIFSYAPDVLGGTFLSPHCSEIPYAFNNVRKSAFSTSGNAEAEKVGDAVSDAWLNFARNGNPNAQTLPQWDAYTIDDGATMFFDAQCHVRTGNFDRHLMELANGK